MPSVAERLPAPPANYVVYLIVVATAGWALASCDLHLSQTLVGLLGTIVYVAQFAAGGQRQHRLLLLHPRRLDWRNPPPTTRSDRTGIVTAPLNLVIPFVHGHVFVGIVYFFIYQATNRIWWGAGYAYQGESFPTRVRATAIWTSLIAALGGATTWLIVAVGGSLGLWPTLLLRDIPPGQDLEAIAT